MVAATSQVIQLAWPGEDRAAAVGARAAQIDAGFDATVLTGMIATLDRFTDGGIPTARPRPDCAFYAPWRAELSA